MRSPSSSQVEVRAERADDERHLLVERRVPQVAEPQVEEIRDAGCLGAPPAGREHLAGRVDADHALPLLGDRDRDPPGAYAELHDGPAGLPRLGDVEPDVLGDAPAPRVVELSDRVVGARPECVAELAQIRHSGVHLRGLRWRWVAGGTKLPTRVGRTAFAAA